MRHFHALVATALIAATTPAAADTFVETIPIAGDVDTQPVFVTGPLFSPALGTLTGVAAVVSGQYRADIFVPASSGLGPSITLALEYSFGSDGSITRGVLGEFQAYTIGDGTYLGETGFDFTQTISAIGAYVEGSLDETNYLAALAFGAVPQPAVGLGASDDFSSWSGDLQLTYTYDPASPVPEPACTGLFALACLSLASARWMVSQTSRHAQAV
jgi:hypothetical protein